MPRKNSLELDEFDLDKYNNIPTIKDLIVMIDDYLHSEISKKTKRRLPARFHKLPNIIDDLCELDSLIGLDLLKQQLLDQILFFVKETDDSVMMHTVIYGPPGTGKTTVARLMSKIYSGLGILKKNKFKEIKREDLIGQYLGETTIKTGEALDACKNGVMFIDEAYSLGSDSSGDSYAKEAIDAINQYLTEHSKDLICIIAGYQFELEQCFFSKNPGLKRRFPWTFSIEQFKPEQLLDVLKLKIKNSDWDYEGNYDDVFEKLKKNQYYFSGNGGDIENILSKAKIINNRKNFLSDDKTLREADILDAMDQHLHTRKSTTDEPPYGMYT
jgi:SpoVK/Ycf46/Vps4 family AAA+-type ATPase